MASLAASAAGRATPALALLGVSTMTVRALLRSGGALSSFPSAFAAARPTGVVVFVAVVGAAVTISAFVAPPPAFPTTRRGWESNAVVPPAGSGRGRRFGDEARRTGPRPSPVGGPSNAAEPRRPIFGSVSLASSPPGRYEAYDEDDWRRDGDYYHGEEYDGPRRRGYGRDDVDGGRRGQRRPESVDDYERLDAADRREEAEHERDGRRRAVRTNSGRRRGYDSDDDYDDESGAAFDDGLFRLGVIADDSFNGNSRPRHGRREQPKRRYSPASDYGRYGEDEEEIEDYEEEEEFEGYGDEEYYEPRWEWESHPSGASVLLPPPGNGEDALPSAVVHFVGGTFFGSYPVTYYGPFLESLARRSNCAIVATPIPVTLKGDPLDHRSLGRRVYRDFVRAYGEVVLDEYGYDAGGRWDAGRLEGVPVVGLGHSLGARILAVLDTYPQLKARPRRRRRPPEAIEAAEDLLCSASEGVGGESKKAGNVLMGFCNYGAVYSVPGVGPLRRGLALEEAEEEREEEERRRRAERERRRERSGRRPRRSRGRDDNEFYYDDSEEYRDFRDRDDYGFRGPPRRRAGRQTSSGGRERGGRRRDRADDYLDGYGYDENDDEDEPDDFLTAMSNEFQSGVSNLRAALTSSIPASSSGDGNGAALEFTPPPGELWNDLGSGAYGREAAKTLVVQFDRDRIDQGGRLAGCIVDGSERTKTEKDGPPSGASSSSEEEGRDAGPAAPTTSAATATEVDVKFARLPGTHLTPVTYGDSAALTAVARGLSSLTRFDDPALRSVRKDRPRAGDDAEREMEDLARCVASYVTEVICGNGGKDVAKGGGDADSGPPVSSPSPAAAVTVAADSTPGEEGGGREDGCKTEAAAVKMSLTAGGSGGGGGGGDGDGEGRQSAKRGGSAEAGSIGTGDAKGRGGWRVPRSRVQP